MKIYVAHSKDMDYINEIYNPIRNCEELQEYQIILPHEESETSNNTREFYKKLDLIISETSFPSTGLGIELGWAYDDNTSIYCLYKKGYKYSGSLKSVTNNFIEYENVEEFLEIVKEIIKNHENTI